MSNLVDELIENTESHPEITQLINKHFWKF